MVDLQKKVGTLFAHLKRQPPGTQAGDMVGTIQVAVQKSLRKRARAFFMCHRAL